MLLRQTKTSTPNTKKSKCSRHLAQCSQCLGGELSATNNHHGGTENTESATPLLPVTL